MDNVLGKVVFDGNDPRAPHRAPKTGGQGPKLVVMPKRERTPAESVSDQLTKILPEVNNFVVFVHKKDGTLDILQCLDSDLAMWEFVDVFKRHTDEAITKRLSGPGGPQVFA